jgi:uncharacterized alkaline shock family protein YloU
LTGRGLSMKTFFRMILVFLGFLLIGAAILLAAINFNLLPGFNLQLPDWVDETALMAGASVLLLIALILLASGLRPRKKESNAVLKGSEFGEVLISIPAIENMVLRVVQQTQGIKDVSRHVSHTADGLVVKIRIRVMPDVALPGLISELQAKTKEHLEEITGITVHEVKVVVENVVMDQTASR